LGKKNNSSVNIRFVAKTSDIRNFSENIRSDVKTSEVATLLTTLWNGQQSQHQGKVQAASIISSFYCDATNMLQAYNCVTITSSLL